jgi:hypothetical protein
MEIEIFTLADFAADYGNGKLVISGTFDSIFSPQFPAVHASCSLALRIRIANSESGTHTIELRSLGPNGKNFQEPIKGDLDVKKNPNADHSTINFVVNFNNLKFETPGKYAFEFHYDNEFRSGLTLTVVKFNPSAPPLHRN